jgi:hypothetical protein
MDGGDHEHILRANAKGEDGLHPLVGPRRDRRAAAAAERGDRKTSDTPGRAHR